MGFDTAPQPHFSSCQQSSLRSGLLALGPTALPTAAVFEYSTLPSTSLDAVRVIPRLQGKCCWKGHILITALRPSSAASAYHAASKWRRTSTTPQLSTKITKRINLLITRLRQLQAGQVTRHRRLKKNSWDLSHGPHIYLEGLRKTANTIVKIASLWVEIWTWNLINMKHECWNHLRLDLPTGLLSFWFYMSISSHSCYVPCPFHPHWLHPF
jgi:hypothetical protein